MMNTLFGFRLPHMIGVLGLAFALSLVSIWAALGFALLATGIVHYRSYKFSRAEAAWEISETGARLLWSDGSKNPKRR